MSILFKGCEVCTYPKIPEGEVWSNQETVEKLHGAFLALINEIERLESANTWHPVDTAPKDDPYAELFCPLAAEGDPDPRAGIYIGWWNDVAEQWEADCGALQPVTHWRKLRPAP